MPNSANPQSLNRFSYVTNSPLKFTDSTGHACDPNEDDRCSPLRAPRRTRSNERVFAGDRKPQLPTTKLTDPPEAVRTQQTMKHVTNILGHTPTYGQIFIMTVGKEGFDFRYEEKTWKDGSKHTLGEFLKEGTIRTFYRQGALTDGEVFLTRLAIDQPWSGLADQDPYAPNAKRLAYERAKELVAALIQYEDDPDMQAWVDELLNNPGNANMGWESDAPWNWFNEPSDRDMGSGQDQVLWTGTVGGAPFTMYTWCQASHLSGHTCSP